MTRGLGLCDTRYCLDMQMTFEPLYCGTGLNTKDKLHLLKEFFLFEIARIRQIRQNVFSKKNSWNLKPLILTAALITVTFN